MKDNTRHPIDELFRNKLNEDQPVSDDSLWEEVEGLMDNRKKKKRFFIFMISVLLMLSGTTAYFLISNNKAGISTYTSVTTPQNQLTVQNQTGSEATAANSAGNSVNNSQKEEVASVSHSSLSITSSQSKNAFKTNDKLNTRTSTDDNSAKVSTASSSPASSISKKHSASVNNAKASIGIKPEKENLNNNISSNQPVNQPISEARNSDLANSNSPGNSIATSDSNDANKSDINVSQALRGNPAAVNNEVDNNSSKKPDVAQADQPSKPKKPTHKPYMKWFIEADGAYMDNFHFISAPTNVTVNYDNIRGSDEKPLATFNYMLKVGAIRKNVMFNTGLGITNVGEKVKYTNHNDDSGKAVIKNSTIFERNGSFINEYVTIPLQVTYLIPIKAVRFQMGIGAAASIPVRWTSYYLNQQVDGLEDPGSLKMVNNIVINLNLTLGLEVPFTRHWAGIVAFNYSRDVSNVFKSGYGVRQEYLSIGGDLGIRYNFAR